MSDNLPYHIGFIPDGNRRWAKTNNKSIKQGYKKGFERLKEVVELLSKEYFDKGIKHCTVYVLSVENIKNRPKWQIEELYKLVKEGVEKLGEISENNIKINILGRRDLVRDDVLEIVNKVEKDTEDNNGLKVHLCLGYTGHEEIVDAVKSIIKQGVNSNKINSSLIKEHLYTKGIPPLDYVIRTGSEDGIRQSGFMLWDSAYAEYKFHEEIHWPDYTNKVLKQDLNEFSERKRRFGK